MTFTHRTLEHLALLDHQPARPRVVSRREWQTERQELVALEQEVLRLQSQLNQQRLAHPMVEVHSTDTFEGPEGPATLQDLFECFHSLIVVYIVADDLVFTGREIRETYGPLLAHPPADAALVFITPQPLRTISAWKNKLGTDIPWYSAPTGSFFETLLDPVNTCSEEWPCARETISALALFRREGARIYHTYSVGGPRVLGLLSAYRSFRQPIDLPANKAQRTERFQGLDLLLRAV